MVAVRFWSNFGNYSFLPAGNVGPGLNVFIKHQLSQFQVWKIFGPVSFVVMLL